MLRRYLMNRVVTLLIFLSKQDLSNSFSWRLGLRNAEEELNQLLSIRNVLDVPKDLEDTARRLVAIADEVALMIVITPYATVCDFYEFPDAKLRMLVVL